MTQGNLRAPLALAALLAALGAAGQDASDGGDIVVDGIELDEELVSTSARSSLEQELVTTSATSQSTIVPQGTGGSAGEPSFEQDLATAISVCRAIIVARVVALDQVYTYNRFGAFNPVGMVYALRRDVISIDPTMPPGPGNARVREDRRPRPLTLRVNQGDCLRIEFTNWLAPSRAEIPPPDPTHPQTESDPRGDAPATRLASVHVNGLQYISTSSDGAYVGRNASSLVAPGDSRTFFVLADRQGSFLFHSMGALAGGEGDGGSLALGLFGAIHVEPPGSRWYRSQVTAAQLAAAQQKAQDTGTPLTNPDGTPLLDFEAVDAQGVPLLRLTSADGELVHGDLDAIIVPPEGSGAAPFREFTSIFHDALRVVQAFEELDTRPELRSIRDGFGINYGASGMGAPLLANRKKVGPTRDCAECRFEEFFLESWANGDPALNLAWDAEGRAVALFPEDPSNVHHSYLGDGVRFRNLHAGPRETHVFHLHGHQWLHAPAEPNSSYLDSQTIGPGSAFTYDIAYGGSGNRNLTVGDAILHCHLYPHFAQGMWALWRSHDVFEAGTPDRRLPDGELTGGVPTPAVVPLPDRPMPPMPTYAPTQVTLADGTSVTRPAMPGYPFYIAGKPGHRPPQPPLDLVHDGGLPRHLVTSTPREEGAVAYGGRGAFDVVLHKANIKLLPQHGTPEEKQAMAFHAGRFPGATRERTTSGWDAAGYPAFTPAGVPGRFLVNGQPPQPGAPLADPCPPSSPVRAYRAAYVQLDVTVNRAGWHDPQARIMVLERDVEATLAGTRPPEPLFIRANSGECVTFEATNLVPESLAADDFQIFTPTDTIGQHIHLVKFDLTASDGAGNGWNYEDGTLAAEEVRHRIAAANAMGGAFAADGTTREQGERVRLTAVGHPRLASAPLGAQTTVQRWWADPLLGASGRDRTIRTAFTHDHFSPSSHQQHGLYGGLVVEPPGASWRDPETGEPFGSRDDGGPTRWRADIIAGTNGADSFREFNLAFADFALLYDAAGMPVNPPTFQEAPLPIAIKHPVGVVAPEAIAENDPGSALVNYRNEPLGLRIASRDEGGQWAQKAGEAGDMANVFRSDLHGDPATPLLRAYEGDRVTIRLLQGAQEEQHVFSLHDHKWLLGPDDPDSGYLNAQALGVSERFDVVVSNGVPATKNRRGEADYLYLSTPTDDLWNGMWGLLRAHDKPQPDLLALPSNSDMKAGAQATPPCPPTAPRRKHVVHALAARGHLPGDRLVYNERFDLHDPDALLFVREEHLEAVRSGARQPEPLILRASAGECVVVQLVNDLPPRLTRSPHWNVLPPLLEGFNVNQVAASSHVSLHAQLVQYDVNMDDGANVGFNQLQTVPPGQTALYHWYAGDWVRRKGKDRAEARPLELGVVNLRDMADVVNHGMHGAVGVLIIEPPGAIWETDPTSDAQATVTYPDEAGTLQRFRELVLVYQDELALHSGLSTFRDTDTSLNSGTALRNLGGMDDPEDSGHEGFNYRTEPFWARLGIAPHQAPERLNDEQQGKLLSSAAHGDPATPVFTARAGEPLRLRVAQPSGHARQHAFALHGAEWPHLAWASGSRSAVIGPNPRSPIISTQGGHSVMRAWNIVPLHGAGGLLRLPGDYLYREQSSMQFSNGLWGILRVTEE